MFTHNFDPTLFDFGFISIRWYSLAYIFGILIGWWYGKKIIIKKININFSKLSLEDFDDLITYLIFKHLEQDVAGQTTSKASFWLIWPR